MEEIKLNDKIYVLKSSINTDLRPIKRKGKEYCIVRTYSAGVFVGWINRKVKGKENTIFDSRRIWYWDGACSLSQLANDGTNQPNKCKFSQLVSEIDLKEIIEILVCTNKSKESIEGVPIWEK